MPEIDLAAILTRQFIVSAVVIVAVVHVILLVVA